jgi:hypothetical protein
VIVAVNLRSTSVTVALLLTIAFSVTSDPYGSAALDVKPDGSAVL